MRELHRAVAHQALHDPLTGLPNRALFFERVRVALARQERSGARFAVVFVDLDDLENLARRLVDRLGQPISNRALHLRVSVSIGVATSEHISSADELLHRADTAMYRANAEGKGRVVHFDVDHPRDVREP